MNWTTLDQIMGVPAGALRNDRLAQEMYSDEYSLSRARLAAERSVVEHGSKVEQEELARALSDLDPNTHAL
jgi:hypothetical protein